MVNKIKISIPEPCHENWQAMTLVEKGRFCDLCQKKVYDFTYSTDREIVQAYNKDNKLCGRFDKIQLNRNLAIPKEKSSVWLVTTSAIISFLGMGTNETFAQGKVKIEHTQNKTKAKNNTHLEEKVEISGIVIDQDNNPVPNISVKISGIEIVKSDSNGKFSILAENCKNILFFDPNDEYSESFYRVDGTNKTAKIVCEKYIYKTKTSNSITGMVRIISTETISVKRRTFVGRIFHSIGNWFK